MAMMNLNTQFESLCQFPSKMSNSYATTTAAPRTVKFNSNPKRLSFPSLQVLGPGNLKLHVSRCNSILLQHICFSTPLYKTAAGYQSVSVTKMRLNEARVKYYGSTGESNDSKEEVNAEVDVNDAKDNQDSVGVPTAPVSNENKPGPSFLLY